MKKTKVDKKKLVQWWLRMYWAGIAVVMLTMLLQTVSVISTTNADSGTTTTPPAQTQQNAQAITTPLTFEEYACKLIGAADPVIWSLVGLTIIIAGIIYATSMGQTGGELSVGLAKQMIVAALTGGILYLLGGFLIGSCGSTTGGWIADLLKGQ
jgi:hypothetical protein